MAYRIVRRFVTPHSVLGAFVGITLAHEHPELLYGYIGTGQLINGFNNDRTGYANTLESAAAAGNSAAVVELKSLSPYPAIDGTVSLDHVTKERKWSVALGGLAYGRTSFAWYGDLFDFSPEYRAIDSAAIDKGSALSLGKLLPEMAHFDFADTTDFHCPIILIEGRRDNTRPT